MINTVEVGGRAFSVVSHADGPELEAAAQGEDFLRQWPQSMFHDPVAAEHYPTMFGRYPDFQFYIQDAAGTVVASGNSIPLAWNGTLDDLPTGWDDGLTRGALGVLSGVEPNTLCAIQAMISGRSLGQGLGAVPVQTMRTLAMAAGFDALIAPVRPSYKERYPLTEIGRYVTWTREDGMLFDPWLRVHQRAGASIMKVAPESMTISGTVADWETWAEMSFPSSGDYIVPGALAPVTMDVENDRGRYVEPNVWMLHALT